MDVETRQRNARRVFHSKYEPIQSMINVMIGPESFIGSLLTCGHSEAMML